MASVVLRRQASVPSTTTTKRTTSYVQFHFHWLPSSSLLCLCVRWSRSTLVRHFVEDPSSSIESSIGNLYCWCSKGVLKQRATFCHYQNEHSVHGVSARSADVELNLTGSYRNDDPASSMLHSFEFLLSAVVPNHTRVCIDCDGGRSSSADDSARAAFDINYQIDSSSCVPNRGEEKVRLSDANRDKQARRRYLIFLKSAGSARGHFRVDQFRQHPVLERLITTERFRWNDRWTEGRHTVPMNHRDFELTAFGIQWCDDEIDMQKL